jgi:hypothetical protein
MQVEQRRRKIDIESQIELILKSLPTPSQTQNVHDENIFKQEFA